MSIIDLIKKITIISIILLIFIIFIGCIGEEPLDNNLSSGDYGEDFEFTLLDGSKRNMSYYKGSVILLDFFGARCAPCQQQMQVLDKIQSDYQRDDFKIISINVWIMSGETISLTQQFIQEFKNQLNIDLDWTFGVDDTQGTLYYKYSPQGVPQLYILDKNGNIYYTKTGYTIYSDLTKKLDDLFEKGGYK